jgi:hypothetical protein
VRGFRAADRRRFAPGLRSRGGSALPAYASLTYSPATWMVNARIALDKLELPFG